MKIKHGALTRRRWLILALSLAVLLGVGGVALAVLQQNSSTDLLSEGVQNNLATARASQAVHLTDGQRYTLNAGFVRNELNGVAQPMLAYNGSTPGPTLYVRQGDSVTVTFDNNTNMDSTIHAHGVRQSEAMDGVPGTSQTPVKVGQSFQYRWTFPDAGVYWYHPHVREDYQQASGLYGAIVVEPKDASYWPAADAAQPLVLSDVLVDRNGELAPFSSEQVDHTLMGRYGNLNLLNGVAGWRAEVPQHSVQRFYVVNASSAKPYRFALAGTKLKVVGSDNGRVGTERLVDAVTLSPGERVVVDARFDTAGQVQVRNDAPGADATLGTVWVTPNDTSTDAAGTFDQLRTNRDVTTEVAGLSSRVVTSKRLAVAMSMDMGSSSGGMDGMSGMDMGGNSSTSASGPAPTAPDRATGNIEWTDDGMNASATGVQWRLMDEDTGKSNGDVNWSFSRGDVVRITIDNKATSMHPMQHPIHLHGQRFAVASIDGQPTSAADWKDTVTVPAGQTYELLVEVNNPGTWLLHCHISEHAENGMSLQVTVK